MKKIFTILGVTGIALLSAQNLVQNPGFESWTGNAPDSWFATGFTVTQSSTILHGGTYSIGATSKKNGDGTNYTASIGASDIAVVAGVTYVYSGWYYDNAPNASMRYWGQWRTPSALLTTETSLQPPASFNNVEGGVWTQFSVEVVAPANATIARLSLRTYAQGGEVGGTIYYDDIVFQDKASMAVTDVAGFDKQIKMNTNVGNALTVILPARATVNIYTAEGKLVSSNRIDSGQSINTSSLTKGMYIVTVDNGTAKVSRKVMKN